MATTTRLGMNKPASSDIIDVNTALDAQYTTLDDAAICQAYTSSTRPVTGLFAGRLIYETDTGNIMKYSGSVWESIQNVRYPRGRVGFATNTGTTTALTFGQEQVVLTTTFTAYAGRQYAFYAGATSESVTGSDVAAYARVRVAAGPTVTTANGTSIGTGAADANDNGVTGANVWWNYHCTWTSNITGQVTAGLCFGNAQASGTETVRLVNFYSYLAAEDIGQ